MLSSADFKQIKTIVTAVVSESNIFLKKELRNEMDVFKKEMREGLNQFKKQMKSNMYTFKDELIGVIRNNQIDTDVIRGYRTTLEDHEDRIFTLEKR